MKKIFAMMLVLTLLTTVFLSTLVDAKSNDVPLTRQNIEINQGISKNNNDVNNLKGIEPVVKVTLPPTATKEPVITLPSLAKYGKLKGTLFNDNSSKERFLLKTDKVVYELIGNTKGLENEIGKTIVVIGNYVYTLIATEYPLFNVESYTVIDMPEITPEPNLQTITGTLSVTKNGVVDKAVTPYAFLLQTQSGPVSLSGKTEGLEKYDGFEVEVTGTYSMLTIYPPIFIVESYKPILAPTPTPDVKIITMADNGGYVYVKPGDELRLELESNPTTGYSWSYATKPDPNVLIETNYEYIPDETDEKIVGSGGKEIWSYKAVNIGSTAIEMIYSRPWESKAPAKTFAVKVIVEELQTIRGIVVVTKNDNPEQKVDSYNFLLKTQSGPVSLSGKTEGLEKYDGFEVEVTGTYSMLTIYPPIFIVESYKPILAPTPTPDVKIITMADNGGYVYVKPGDELRLELESNPTTGYSWSYATKPDPNVLIETNYEYIPDETDEKIVGSGGKEIWSYKAVNIGSTAIEMIYSRPWESKAPAKTFAVKVIVEELQTIRGIVVVTKNDNPEQKVDSYNFLLKTQSGPVSLSGKTEGLEKYDGFEVEVTGTYSLLTIYPPIFIVESYKLVATPIPTSIPVPTVRPIPIPTVIPVPTEKPIPIPTIKPIPTVRPIPIPTVIPVPTEKPIPTPTIKPIPTVRPIPTLIPVPTEKPIPIPTIRPEPTAVPLSKTHTIISEKVLGIAIPGVTFSNISGYTTISWTEGSTNAFFNSKINADKDVYELELVSVEKSDSYEIVGLFNIKKNGKLLVKELNGRLYGLSNDEGDYFKFYSEGEKYHMSAYITKRIDF